MLKSILAASILFSAVPTVSLAAPSQSINAQTPPQPTTEQIYQACTQDRAETLPNPFVDVAPNHWAYKAVLSMHYCGAFRRAAPRSLFERTQPTPTTPQSTTPQS
ncbi:hypothetical protein NC981_04615 [Leptolyngbya sp. DQ-M1]|uniref:hypothetical protein n=1 Tax=Leptolyngbya sp. DQ-M1 TaxID=2933920 RepID=UPI003299F576